MWHGADSVQVPVTDRFDWFAQTVSNALMPSAFAPQDAAGFHAEGAFLDLGAAQVSRFSYAPLRSWRTPALIRRGDPEQYQLGLVTRGSAWYAQGDSEAELYAGDMVLWDTSRPYKSGSGLDGGTVDALVLQIPKARMPLPSQQIDRLLARRMSSGTGMGAILAQFLVSLAGSGPDCRPLDLGVLANSAVELAVSCLSQQLGAEVHTPAGARAQVMRRRIDAFIEQRLGDPGLTPRAIADHHHISLRTLYTLFQSHDESLGAGEGVAAVIRRRRLERCRADLARPQLRHLAVHVIAARWGFTSAASFNRTFRASYGTTPHAYRTEAMGSGRRV
ncbi:helix-turn-helix domain-containing protein [Streptomyces sp. VRA16 Mangrove soil]|uniref:AraC-like ligand-binding domain-containing protein n=1 Tax=Streptomyces sp. VRA16 Mangrove soil TaxID=2817434 RepID=UPI001A9D2F10|nr:helix-turn-helix domain-containing protein [Streptomyces sp. VRA16 Mangrove soil]MBO1331402.1 helix-turn-helix domain-containing protein [Streptomyces sp. VRA16 Mangrove soil]